MITRLQFVILCRVQRGLQAFAFPATHATPPHVLTRRREALADLYHKRFIKRGRRGPVLTERGSKMLQWITSPEMTRSGKAKPTDYLTQESQRTGEPRRNLEERLAVARRLWRSKANLEAVAKVAERATTLPLGTRRA